MTGSGPVLVLGAGRSGQAVMDLLASLGRKAVQVADGLAELDEGQVSAVSEAVVSPGFPIDHPWLECLRQADVPLVSEVEFGARYVRSKALAVTGSLGKTTIVHAAVAILREAGFSAEAVGNIGRPVSELACRREHPDWMVVEVSSFQLETMSGFAPDAALILNVFPNHLDRHGDLETYRALKLSLFRAMDPEAPRAVGPNVLAPDDLSPSEMPEGLSPLEKMPEGLSLLEKAEGLSPLDTPLEMPEGLSPLEMAEGLSPLDTLDIRYEKGALKGLDGAFIPLDGSIFDNRVLGTNAAVLASVLLRLGISQAVVSEGFKKTSAPAHRMQTLGFVDGVRYVDDSKSTCIAATRGALRQLSGPVRLLLGGRAKQRDFSDLQPLIEAGDVWIYAFGEAGPEIREDLGPKDVFVFPRFREAVERVVSDAESGETVLLSPGCTSFDEFASYAQRGDQFQTLLEHFKQF